MDDREAVAAIVAGDQAGLADIYDRYAASLYGYCRNMLHEPADAADAVQDTFVIAAARLNGLRDSHKLRPWLYAVARNECLRKLRTRETPSEIEETEDITAAEVGESAQRTELRELVRAAIWGLNPPDREVIELNLRHDLDGADLATVLGVSRSHAHAMASRARGQLERSLGVLLVARTGRRACPALDLMLTDWDGRLTILLRKRVSRHIDQCEECGERKRDALRPAMLFGLPALPLLPPRLRDHVLHLCADETPAPFDRGEPSPRTPAAKTKQSIVKQAGSFGPNGFPRPKRDRRHGMGDPAAAMVAAASVAVAAAVIIAMIVLRGSTPSTLEAKAGDGAAGAVVNSSTEVPPNSSLLSPTVTRPGSRSAAVRPPVASPGFPFSTTNAPSATPSRSHRPRPSKSPKPSKSPSQSPSPSPSPTTTSPSPSPSTTPPVTHSPSPPPTTKPPTTTPPPGTG